MCILHKNTTKSNWAIDKYRNNFIKKYTITHCYIFTFDVTNNIKMGYKTNKQTNKIIHHTQAQYLKY